ncbi:class I SAM-dependent methyltransferase [Microbacterium maritypicum]
MSTETNIASAYDARAVEYLAVAGDLAKMDDRDIATIRAWRDGTTGPLLDAGCGPGHWTAFLAEDRGDVVGVDLSGEFIASARGRYPGIRFEVGSFRGLGVDDSSLGGILAWYSLIHTPPAEIPLVLAEFARVLRPGGTLLLGFFDGEPRAPFAHAVTTACFWSADALGGLLTDAGFEVEGSEHRDRTPQEVSARAHGAIRARRR